jgi:hypothetical protein
MAKRRSISRLKLRIYVTKTQYTEARIQPCSLETKIGVDVGIEGEGSIPQDGDKTWNRRCL